MGLSFNTRGAACQLDPIPWANSNLAFSPDPLQAQVLASTSPRLILCCTRQWGKSTVTALEAVHCAWFHPKALVLIAAPTLRQSGEWIRKAAAFLLRLGAAARELLAVHRCVVDFGHVIGSGRGVPSRTHTAVKRIRMKIDRIQNEMREVEVRTLVSNAQTGSCRIGIETVKPALAPRRPTVVLTLDQHIRAARALGDSQPAVLRFLDIISSRKHLPVRIIDIALAIHDLVQLIRCQMEDVQFATLRGQQRWVNCWLRHFNCFDGDEAGATAGAAAGRPSA